MRKGRTCGRVAIVQLLVLTPLVLSAQWQEQPDWAGYFEQAGVPGTIAILELRNREKRMAHNVERAGQRYMPASTFKVPHALFALDAAVVRDEFEVTEYSIVGAVASVRHMAPDEESRNPTVYAHSAKPGAQVQLLMRTSIAPDLLAADVRNALEQELGPDRVGFVSTLESMVRRTVRDREPPRSDCARQWVRPVAGSWAGFCCVRCGSCHRACARPGSTRWRHCGMNDPETGNSPASPSYAVTGE